VDGGGASRPWSTLPLLRRLSRDDRTQASEHRSVSIALLSLLCSALCRAGLAKGHSQDYTEYGIMTTTRTPPLPEKPLHWVGSAKKDLLAFPEQVVGDFGYALSVVQQGRVPPSSKPWKGEGPGVFELVEDFRSDTWRVVYTARFEKAVYVLHCFQKKSPSGIRTARTDVVLIHERLKTARADYEVRYAEKT